MVEVKAAFSSRRPRLGKIHLLQTPDGLCPWHRRLGCGITSHPVLRTGTAKGRGHRLSVQQFSSEARVRCYCTVSKRPRDLRPTISYRWDGVCSRAFASHVHLYHHLQARTRSDILYVCTSYIRVGTHGHDRLVELTGLTTLHMYRTVCAKELCSGPPEYRRFLQSRQGTPERLSPQRQRHTHFDGTKVPRMCIT